MIPEEVAKRIGYADGHVAHLAVNAFLQKAALEQAPEHRRAALDLEVQRLDSVQAAHWEAATTGHDYKAANVVLRVITKRCALLGLDRPVDGASDQPYSIVISGTSEEYIAGLRAVIGDDA